MRLPSLASFTLALAAAVATAGCGGGSTGLGSATDIRVVSSALPLTNTGMKVHYVIPIEGACPGPYVMAVVDKSLPEGLYLDNDTLSIQGIALRAGTFTFTIQIDATGCKPFATTQQTFTWTIGIGPVAIVLCDPPFIPVDEYTPPNQAFVYPDADGLQTTVLNQLATFNFKAAGGVGPYSLSVEDDPGDPEDKLLPDGMTAPAFGTSLYGTSQVPGLFRFTLRVTDSQGQTGVRKVQWKVDTPPIVVATTSLPAGKCGTAYSQTIQIVDGVPPFEFELTRDAATSITFVEGSEPTITSGGAPFTVAPTGEASNKCTAADYTGGAGPFTGITPRGLYLREDTGTLGGIPRYQATFTFHVHVYSANFPKAYGQHAWHTYTVPFANSEPPLAGNPAFSFKPATWTVEGGTALLGASPWSTLPELEVGVAYNPDGGTAGLSMISQGGVPKDGLTDAPHFSQVTNINGTGSPPAFEYGTGYDWTINWDADSVGAPAPPAGVTFTTWTGIITVPNSNLLIGRGRTNISFTCTDQQLPTAHTISGNAAYSIGPDKVIITESTTSTTATNMDATFNDYQVTVRKLLPFSSGATITNLVNAQDLAGTIPATTTITTIDTLLAGIDLMRITINPTTYRDDVHGLNANGARQLQHGDPNKSYTYSNPTWQSGANPQAANASSTCIELPSAPAVTHNPGSGVFNDGGKMYGFQGSGKFGIFIIRSNSSISVPVAFSTSGGYSGFGDGTVDPWGASKNSILQTIQMAVSPDGRFGACKLKTNTASGHSALTESAASTKIVVFSLTGETPFGGATYFILNTGSSGGSTSGGIYQYAASLALTNNHLYYLCGNDTSTYSAYRQHLIYRYTITSGSASGALLTTAVADAEWANTTGSTLTMMQTPFQKFENPMTVTSTLLGFNPTTFGTITYPNTEMYTYDGWNMVENGIAPIPFRVSGNGSTCALLAGIETGSTSHTNNMNHHVWVDVSGAGVRRISTVRRHSPQGAARGYTLGRGPGAYMQWARYNGPTTGFEISHDATKVAVCVNRSTASISLTSSSNWYNYRQDVIAFSTTNAWNSATEHFVTGNDSGTTVRFGGAGTHLWRFGALIFTKDNAGLIFWGGRNAQNNTVSTTYENSVRFTGTFYSYNFSSDVVRSIFATADGGNDLGINTTNFTTGTPYNPTPPGGTTSQTHGRIRPGGGFISKSGDYFYCVHLQAISGSIQRSCGLVGINIRSLSGAVVGSQPPEGNGFVVGNQHTRRGFLPVYYYYNYYAMDYRYYSPGGSAGFGEAVMAKTAGTVYWTSYYQANGPSIDNSTTSSFHGGSTTASYWGDYGAYGNQVEGFLPDIGGPIQRITLASLGTVDGAVNRGIHWIETTPDGKALAFVYDTAGPGNRNYSTETAVYLQKIAFNTSTGVLSSTPVQFILAGSGRVGESMAIDSTGNKLFYAFGSGNENTKTIAEVAFNPASNTITTRTVGATPKRYNVLSSGR